MAEPLVDVDLDALAPLPKRVKLSGKLYKLPGDLPMPLFLRIQNYEQRVENGENEVLMLAELQNELLSLFQVHQPNLKVLPEIGVRVLLQAIGAIYGGAVGEPVTPPSGATRPEKKKTQSPRAPARRTRRATSA